MSRADEFRKNADECRQQAAKAFNPLDKDAYAKVPPHGGFFLRDGLGWERATGVDVTVGSGRQGQTPDVGR
jgi:hypothetical protein